MGPARSAIAGFALTSANYGSAVELLNKRYGKKTAIQRAYVKELLNIVPVYNERDAQRLRSMYDFVETKHRALQALELDEGTYSAIVVPSILEKLPHALRLTTTRGEPDHHDWSLGDLLKALGQEVELREEYDTNNERRARNTQGDFRKKNLSTLHAGRVRKTNIEEKNCVFCLRTDHRHEDCPKVEDVEERKRILFKYGRCFNCLRKGHLAKDCSNNVVVCNSCGEQHHSAICIAPQGNTPEIENRGAQGNSMHVETPVGTGTSVALQTAQAQIAGKGSVRVRVFV